MCCYGKEIKFLRKMYFWSGDVAKSSRRAAENAEKIFLTG